MKKKILTAICVLGCVLFTACSKNNSADETNSDVSAVQIETQADTPDDSTHTEKDFVGDSYSDTGEGTFLLVNASGNTESGNVIVVYTDADTTLTQIGYETSEMNGGSLSYIYIDGMLSTKEQLGDSQGSLGLSGDTLAIGTHKVEVVQYENDSVDESVTVYKSAAYEVKEK